MKTNIVLDDELVNEAFSYSQTIRTPKGLIETALREYVNNRKPPNLNDLVGKIKFHDNYDYKSTSMENAEQSDTKRSKLDIVESLFGIIPNNGITLAELREERLTRYENTD